MSASYSFSLFSRFSTFFLTQEDLQNFYDSPLVFCLSLPSAGRHGLFESCCRETERNQTHVFTLLNLSDAAAAAAAADGKAKKGTRTESLGH